MSGYRIEIVADTVDHCGEGPLWHDHEKALYWTDIPKGRVYRTVPGSGHVDTVYEGMQVGGITLQADGSLALFGEEGRILRWRDGETSVLLDGIPDELGTRFNDVIADPEGRVFAGTMPLPAQEDRLGRLGRLYRIDPDLSWRPVLHGIGCANGMDFTSEGRRFLFTDTTTREIGWWTYDRTSGAIDKARLFMHTREDLGGPDGLTLDWNDQVWSASWGGGGVFAYDWHKRLVDRIDLPGVSAVTCPIFGGENLDTLYVTSAQGQNRGEEWPNAGALFEIRGLRAPGRPAFRSRLGL